jgi:hypothetical protein
LARELINVRRLNVRCAVASEVAVTEIVRQDKNNVGGVRLRGAESQQRHEEKEAGENWCAGFHRLEIITHKVPSDGQRKFMRIKGTWSEFPPRLELTDFGRILGWSVISLAPGFSRV